MGQIFNRIKNIASSYLQDVDLSVLDPLDNEDDDLKRMIDELRNEPKQKDNKEEYVKPDENVSIENAYDILSVSKNSSNEELKIAYKKRVQEYHPDRVSKLGKEIQDLAEMKTKQINAAYSLIKQERGL